MAKQVIVKKAAEVRIEDVTPRDCECGVRLGAHPLNHHTGCAIRAMAETYPTDRKPRNYGFGFHGILV